MQKISTAAFVSMTRALDKLRRERDLRGLRTLMGSKGFLADLQRLTGMQQATVLQTAGDLMADLQSELGPLITLPQKKGFKWDAAKIAKLRQANERYGNDKDIARALGITFWAAQRARLRYCGNRSVEAQVNKAA